MAIVCAAGASVACQGDPGYDGRSSAEWIADLDARDAARRERAATALGNVLRIDPRSRRTVDALIRTLNDPEDGVRVAAAASLVSAGVRADGAVPALHRALHDTAHERVRALAARALGELRPQPPDASIAVLVEALADPSARVRAAAAMALGAFGPAARSAAASLARLVTDADGRVRATAMDGLTAMGLPAESLRTQFERALIDGTPESRASAAYHIGRLGPAARASVPGLLRASADSAPSVQAAAAAALIDVAGADVRVRARLRVLAADPDSVVRRAALQGPVPDQRP